MQTGPGIRLLSLPRSRRTLESHPCGSQYMAGPFRVFPFEDKGGSHPGPLLPGHCSRACPRRDRRRQARILLTLATGTGKTFIAFQIAWKLFQSRWNFTREPTPPAILFLADRNILADQAYNAFSAFPEDALVRIGRPTFARKAAFRRTAASSSRSFKPS